MKAIFILIVILFSSVVLHSQSVAGSWSTLDGTVIFNFQANGVFLLEVPKQTLTEEDMIEDFTGSWKVESEVLYLKMPGGTDTSSANFKVYPDSLVLVNEDKFKTNMKKADSIHRIENKSAVDNFLSSGKNFLFNLNGDDYDITLDGNKYFEDGEEFGTWETFWFYNNLFFIIDYGEGDVELYRIRKFENNTLFMSMSDSDGTDENLDAVIFATLVAH